MTGDVVARSITLEPSGARRPAGRDRRRSALGPGLLVACALALGFPSAAHAEAAPSALPRGAMPFRPPGGQPPRTAATFGPAAATPTTNLDYYGGPVVSAPQVVQVVYGTGSFLPEVTGTIAPSVDAFLQNLVGSGYLTELAEFDTVGITSVNGRAGTGQHVVAGTYLGQRTITPAPARNGVVIYDADLQAELEAQIEAPSSALPPPAADATGAARTIYSVFFRNGQRICAYNGGPCSLLTGGFCAYHSSFRMHGTGPVVLYTVEPDLTGFSNRGCGAASDFGITTASLSHEISEVVTDPYVGFATALDYPLAWYDDALAENADICEQDYAPLTFAGQPYTVQQTWSNVARACVTMGLPRAPGEFSKPAEVSVLTGSSTSVSVRALGAGSGAYTVAGLPVGVTAVFSANPIAPGQTATLTLNAAPTAPGGSTVVTVANDAPFSAPLTVTVVVAKGSAPSTLDASVPLARLADTRATGAVSARGVLRVHATATGATAVVLNVVAADATTAGYVTVWPCAQPQPLASSLNTVPQRIVANLVTVAVGSDGDVCLFNSAGTVQLVVDQFGAYKPVTGAARAGRLVPLAPTRALDTRSSAVPFAGGETRTLDLKSFGVPATATAVVLTLTAADAPANGYWAVWPSGPWPGTSNLNVSAGQTLANQAIVPVATGTVQLRGLVGGHLVVDVAGYFTGPDAPPETAGLFHAMTPERAWDTRDKGGRGLGGTLTLTPVVPTIAAAVLLNVTVTGPAAPGFLTVFPGGAAAPLASNVNYAGSETVPGHVVVGTTGGQVGLKTNVVADLVIDVGGWYS